MRAEQERLRGELARASKPPPADDGLVEWLRGLRGAAKYRGEWNDSDEQLLGALTARLAANQSPGSAPFSKARQVFAGKTSFNTYLLKVWFDSQEDLDAAFDLVEAPVKQSTSTKISDAETPCPKCIAGWVNSATEPGAVYPCSNCNRTGRVRRPSQPPRVTYSQACALLAAYVVAVMDRTERNADPESHAAYMKATKACTDAMGAFPSSPTKGGE
jgi:hypothetical protein